MPCKTESNEDVHARDYQAAPLPWTITQSWLEQSKIISLGAFLHVSLNWNVGRVMQGIMHVGGDGAKKERDQRPDCVKLSPALQISGFYHDVAMCRRAKKLEPFLLREIDRNVERNLRATKLLCEDKNMKKAEDGKRKGGERWSHAKWAGLLMR